MKMLLSVASLAVLLSSLTGCSSCGDRNPCDNNPCDDDRMFGMGMFHKKHFGFGRKDCDVCSTGGPILDGGIGQAAGCGCDGPGRSAMMPVSTSACGCNCGSDTVPAMPVSLNNSGPGLPPGTIVTETVPTPAPAMGGAFPGTNPGIGLPGPGD